MGKAAQEKVRFRWYDMTRYEVSNKVRHSVRRHLSPGCLSGRHDLEIEGELIIHWCSC